MGEKVNQHGLISTFFDAHYDRRVSILELDHRASIEKPRLQGHELPLVSRPSEQAILRVEQVADRPNESEASFFCEYLTPIPLGCM